MNSILRRRARVRTRAGLWGSLIVGLTATACSQPEAYQAPAAEPSEAQATPIVGLAPDAEIGSLLARWPAGARAAAEDQIRKYGAPQDVTKDTLTWRHQGPWLWTRIDRAETAHSFPSPHFDSIEQAVYFRVPVDKVDDLSAFDGSVTVYKTRGYLSARSGSEAANFLALNLAHDIITGVTTAAEARTRYAAAMTESRAGRTDPYMTELRFRGQRASAAVDPDRSA